MKAAIKTIDVTPPIGSQMAGYSERKHGAIGIHDPLLAHAIVLDDGLSKIAYVVIDVTSVDSHFTKKVREIVLQETGIEFDHVMIGGTHTHSGSAATKLNARVYIPIKQFDPNGDAEYYSQLIKKVAGVIIWANNSLEEASIGIGTGIIDGLGTNRNNIDDYYDPAVSIIKLNRKDGSLLGAIINHACHPTVLNFENYLFTADYIGYLKSQLKDHYPESEFVFSQGAAGSASTRYTKKSSTFEEASRLASIITDEVLRVLPKVEMVTDISVSGTCEDFSLEIRDFLKEDECIKEIERCKLELQNLIDNKAEASQIRKAYVTLQGSEKRNFFRENIDINEVTSELQCLDFGIFKLIGIPADCFGEIARDIMNIPSNKPTLVAGYVNDALGYVLSKEGYAVDSYERSITLYKETSHQFIVDGASKLINNN
ncbi:MAG: neutral/alkaline non-lysosomal ceramidase N-terminal domain-containing protein [Erysipelotrichaceae bacterium]